MGFTHQAGVMHIFASIDYKNQSLQWRHNGLDGVSNHQPHDCLLKRLFRHISQKTSKLRVTGLCAVNSPETGEFPAPRASNTGNVSIWWRHHVLTYCQLEPLVVVVVVVVVVRSLFKWHVAWYTNRYKSWYITIHITLAYLPPSLTGLISHYRVPHTWWQDTTGRDNCWIQCWQC